jgi:hypothetical protein
MKTGMRKSTEQKYLDVFNQIYHALRLNPKANINDICVVNGVTHNLASMMIRVGIIQKSNKGLIWIDVLPNLNQVRKIHDYRTRKNAIYRSQRNQIEIEFKEPIKRTRKKKEPIQVNNQKVLEFKLFGLSIFKLVK